MKSFIIEHVGPSNKLLSIYNVISEENLVNV